MLEQSLLMVQNTIARLESKRDQLKRQSNVLKKEERQTRIVNAQLIQQKSTITCQKSQKISQKKFETRKKYDAMRAGVLQKHTIQLKSIRKRQQLIDTTQLATIQKLKLKQKFKKKLAKIKLELNKHGINAGFESQIKVNVGPLFHDNGCIKFDSTKNGQYIASVGQLNGILHIRDWNDESLFMTSLLERCTELDQSSFDWYVEYAKRVDILFVCLQLFVCCWVCWMIQYAYIIYTVPKYHGIAKTPLLQFYAKIKVG